MRFATKLQASIILFFMLAVIALAYLSIAFSPEVPTILSASVSPQKVRIGDTMLVTAEVQDAYGIASVTADMAGIEW